MSYLILKQMNYPLLRSGSPVVSNFLKVVGYGVSKIECPESNCRGLKSLIKIKWKRPEPVPFNDSRKTGDKITGLDEIDMEKTTLEFAKSKSLKDANENVKKVFSCDHHGKKHAVEIIKKDLIDTVKRHNLDSESREVLITKYTVSIRSLQEHYKKNPQDKLSKVWLKELIDKRNKYLRLLRMEDYQKFEWILEHLKIEFRPGPSILNNVHRKESLRRLVDKHIDDVKTNRLTELRNKFNQQKIDFYKKKAETLEWILEQEKKYGKEPTVSEEEIQEVWKKYEELLAKSVDKYEPPRHYHQFA